MAPETAERGDAAMAPATAAGWPFKRCLALGVALGLLAVTVIAVATRDAASAALGGAFSVFFGLLTVAPVWDALPPVPCPECGGDGELLTQFRHGIQVQDCAECLGSGVSSV